MMPEFDPIGTEADAHPLRLLRSGRRRNQHRPHCNVETGTRRRDILSPALPKLLVGQAAEMIRLTRLARIGCFESVAKADTGQQREDIAVVDLLAAAALA